MNIRILTKEDVQGLVELYGHLNPNDVEPDSEAIDEIWAQTHDSNLIQYIGLYIQGYLVSACQKVVVPNLTRGGRPYCVIENVVTHGNYRNMGCGKKLLRHVLSLAWEEGCYKVMLMSGRKEESVMKFYRDVGFSSDEKRAFVIRRDDA